MSDGKIKEEAITVPPAEPNFWVSEAHLGQLERIYRRTEKGEQINVFISGPKGCGKTTLAREYASRYRRPFYEVHSGTFIDAEQWFGKDRLFDGETWYRKSRFIHALESPNTVVLLDEINRAHPEVLGAIMGLLDWRRSLWNDDLGYQVKVAPGVVFFATINEGDDYYGTNPMDAALIDRFSRTILLDYPPEAAEASILEKNGLDPARAKRLARFAVLLRKADRPVPVSTRQLLTTADELADGVPLREAAEVSLINGLSDGTDRKTALEALQLIDDEPYTGGA